MTRWDRLSLSVINSMSAPGRGRRNSLVNLDHFESVDLILWSVRPQKFIVEWFSAIKHKFSKINSSDDKNKDADLEKHLHILSHLCEKTEQINKCKIINPQIKSKAKQAIAKVQSDLLEETDITFSQSNSIGDLKKFYCLDTRTRESGLLSQMSHTDIGLYQCLLQHSATSTMLQEAQNISDSDISRWFSKSVSYLHWIVYLLIAIFYPILEILSICPPWFFFKKLRMVLSTYPVSYFVNWGSYLWTTILLFIYQKLDGSGYKYDYVILIILWVLCLGKIKDEKEQWCSLGNANSFKKKANAYFFDKWNYIDFALLTSFIIYLVIATVSLIIKKDYDYDIKKESVKFQNFSLEIFLVEFSLDVTSVIESLEESQAIVFILLATIMCLSLLHIFAMSPVLGSATEATLIMIKWAFTYFIIVSVLWIGFYQIGLIVLPKHLPLAGQTVDDLKDLMLRNLFGLIDSEELDSMKSNSGAFFWTFYYVFMVIIVLNGLIAIMTTSLHDDMSEEVVRQRFNFIRYNLICFEGEYNFWPNPFNLLKGILDGITERMIGKIFNYSDIEDRSFDRRTEILINENDEERAGWMATYQCLKRMKDEEKLTNLISSVKISLGYLLRDNAIAFVYDENDKNLFMILAEMNNLLKNRTDIQSVLSEYFNDNWEVLHNSSNRYKSATTFHFMCKYGNIEMLKISMRWLSDAPKDFDGKTALEYSILRLKEMVNENMDYKKIEKLPIAVETQEFVKELFNLCKQYSISFYPLILEMSRVAQAFYLLKNFGNNELKRILKEDRPTREDIDSGVAPTPLHAAIEAGNDQAVQFYIEELEVDLDSK